MGKRTGRPRGAPRGNQNRRIHGRYSAAAKAEREALLIERDRLKLLAVWTDALWRVQKLEDRGVVLSDPFEA
ncbi:MAG TPA: hypothetical protein VMF58_05880 [Rhizomicrobium sp.]|nr:hypothetical protein [Rhizomicrobium sp.]